MSIRILLARVALFHVSLWGSDKKNLHRVALRLYSAEERNSEFGEIDKIS